MYLYHYFDRRDGPFRSLSDCAPEEARRVLEQLRLHRPGAMVARRGAEYIETRLGYEATARRLFLELGGKPERLAPHSMVVEACPWLADWYEQPACVRIPVDAFDPSTLSFTYGDLHPTFSPRVADGREYRKRLYDLPGILRLIGKYGLPQQWNADGQYGPERYIEAQVWSDEAIRRYRDAAGVTA